MGQGHKDRDKGGKKGRRETLAEAGSVKVIERKPREVRNRHKAYVR